MVRIYLMFLQKFSFADLYNSLDGRVHPLPIPGILHVCEYIVNDTPAYL